MLASLIYLISGHFAGHRGKLSISGSPPILQYTHQETVMITRHICLFSRAPQTYGAIQIFMTSIDFSSFSMFSIDDSPAGTTPQFLLSNSAMISLTAAIQYSSSKPCLRSHSHKLPVSHLNPLSPIVTRFEGS